MKQKKKFTLKMKIKDLCEVFNKYHNSSLKKKKENVMNYIFAKYKVQRTVNFEMQISKRLSTSFYNNFFKKMKPFKKSKKGFAIFKGSRYPQKVNTQMFIKISLFLCY